MVKVRATRSLENALRRWGFHLVAGCDEVGRGCLAGPVVAGAVILAATMRRFGLERALVSETDILDGLAFEMLGVG